MRKIVNNPKGHDGLYMKIRKTYCDTHARFYVESPWKENYLLGIMYLGNDVTLNNNSQMSVWMFDSKGLDQHGHPCYVIWAENWGLSDNGDIFMPEFSVARAGYDKDWEWRTYTRELGAPWVFRHETSSCELR